MSQPGTEASRALLIVALLLFAPATFGDGLDYGFVDVGYQYAELGDAQLGFPNGAGFGLRLSYALADRLHVGAELRRLNLDGRFRGTDFDASQVQGRLVGGVNLSFTSRLDLLAQVSAENFRADSALAGIDVNEWGYGVAGGLRWRIGQLELNGLARYVDYTGFAEEVTLQAAALYRLSERTSIGLQGETDDTFDDGIVMLFLRVGR